MTITSADKITQVSKQLEFYSDFFDNMEKHPISGNLMKVTNEKSIIQSIKNLIYTNIGDRVFEPLVGSNVYNSLFELNDAATYESLKYNINLVIKQFEPRVELTDVTIDTTNVDRNSLSISITFYIINNTTPITTSIVLKRVR